VAEAATPTLPSAFPALIKKIKNKKTCKKTPRKPPKNVNNLLSKVPRPTTAATPSIRSKKGVGFLHVKGYGNEKENVMTNEDHWRFDVEHINLTHH